MMQVEVAGLADHPRQDLARHRLGRSENHRLDPAHPFAPAQLGRQVLEFEVEGDFRLWRAAPSLRARRAGRSPGRSARVRRRARRAARTAGATPSASDWAVVSDPDDRVVVEQRLNGLPGPFGAQFRRRRGEPGCPSRDVRRQAGRPRAAACAKARQIARSILPRPARSAGGRRSPECDGVNLRRRAAEPATANAVDARGPDRRARRRAARRPAGPRRPQRAIAAAAKGAGAEPSASDPGGRRGELSAPGQSPAARRRRARPASVESGLRSASRRQAARMRPAGPGSPPGGRRCQASRKAASSSRRPSAAHGGGGGFEGEALAPDAGPGRRGRGPDCRDELSAAPARKAASAVVSTGPRGVAQPGTIGGGRGKSERFGESNHARARIAVGGALRYQEARNPPRPSGDIDVR